MKDKVTFQERMQKFAAFVQSNVYIKAITDSLMSLLPVTIVGAVGSLINALPVKGYQAFLVNNNLKVLTSIPNEVTNNLLALYAVYLIAVKFAESHDIDGNAAGMLSLMSYLIVTPLMVKEDGISMIGLSSEWLGAKGLFSAFLIALIVGKIYTEFQVRGWTIKMPEGVPPTVTKSFSGLVPSIVLMVIMVLIRFVFLQTSYESIHSFIFAIVAAPLTSLGSTFTAALIAVIMIHVFWFFGIHGTLVIIAVFTPIWTPLGNENLAAFNAGLALPHLITRPLVFQSIVTGSGQTLGLTLAMLRAKSTQYKTIGRLALVPNICGINEPVIFGTPLVMNFRMLIPFVLTPTLTFVLAYILVRMGILLMLPGITTPLGTPVILSGFIASAGNWRWAVFQFLIVIMSYIIYRPFFKPLDEEAYQAELDAQKNE